MTQRVRMKARRVADDGAHLVESSSQNTQESSDGGQISELLSERDQLKEQLARAEARIAELEGLRKQALDRMDWVIDSLEAAVDKPR